MLDWEWYGDPNTMCLFIHLLLTSNYEKKIWHGTEIEAGQKVTSLPDLAEETGLTIQQARTSILKLKSTGEITDKTTNKFRLITIKKWSEYQEVNRQNNSQITGQQQANQQASNRQHIRTRASERSKEERNKEYPLPPKGGQRVDKLKKPFIDGDPAYYDEVRGMWRVQIYTGEWKDYQGDVKKNLTYR